MVKWCHKMSRKNVVEVLNRILNKAMSLYEKQNDLGITFFLFNKSGNIVEIPIKGDGKGIQFSKNDVEGVAICGKLEVQEGSLLTSICTMGIEAIGVVYHSSKEDYFFYNKILHHDLDPKSALKFRFSDIKRISNRDGFKLDNGFIQNLLPSFRA